MGLPCLLTHWQLRLQLDLTLVEFLLERLGLLQMSLLLIMLALLYLLQFQFILQFQLCTIPAT